MDMRELLNKLDNIGTSPTSGDGFILEFSDKLEVETEVLEITESGDIVILGDDKLIGLLEDLNTIKESKINENAADWWEREKRTNKELQAHMAASKKLRDKKLAYDAKDKNRAGLRHPISWKENAVEEEYDQSHNGPYDRGRADSYYGRRPNPHKWIDNSDGTRSKVELTDPKEIEAYKAGYRDNDDFKDWGEDIGEGGDPSYNKYIIPHLDVLIDAVEQGRDATRSDPRISWYRTAMRAIDKGYRKTHHVESQRLNNALDAAGIVHTTTNTNNSATASKLLDYLKSLKQQTETIAEAEYHGRKVPLGKPMKGDVKKSKVYVRNPKTGKVVKVNFGDKKMRIKKSNPKRRKSFRARHNCANPGPRTKARYWSCRAW